MHKSSSHFQHNFYQFTNNTSYPNIRVYRLRKNVHIFQGIFVLLYCRRGLALFLVIIVKRLELQPV